MGQCPINLCWQRQGSWDGRNSQLAVNMASNDDGWKPDILHGKLARLEAKIQLLIEAFTKLGHRSVTAGHGPFNRHRSARFKKNCAALRQRMRTVRRWRNGSEVVHITDLEEISAFILNVRKELIETRISILTNTVTQLEKRRRVRGGHVTETKNKLTALHAGIANLQNTMKNAEGNAISLCNLLLTEEKLDHFETLADKLNNLLSMNDVGVKPRLSRNLTVNAKVTYTNIEDHPLINALLRNDVRIRRIAQAMIDGHHVNTDKGCCADTCAENDNEVLRRQLQKVERWRRCEQEFSAENIDDLELIVSAIESHLREDLDTIDAKNFMNADNIVVSRGSTSGESNAMVFSRQSTVSMESEPDVQNTSADNVLVNERLI